MKEKAKKKGGKRKGAGRKPSPKKTPVTGYFDDATLRKFGGKEGLRVAFYKFASGAINPAHEGFMVFDAPPLPKTTKDEFDFQDAKKKFPPSDRKVKQKGVPLPDDYVKFSKVKAMKPDGTVIADLTQPTPALKPQEQPKTNFSIATAPKTLDELKSLCPAELTGFDRSAWIAKERQRYGI